MKIPRRKLKVLDASFALETRRNIAAVRPLDNPFWLFVVEILLLLFVPIVVLVVLINGGIIKVRIFSPQKSECHLPSPLFLSFFLASWDFVSVFREDLPIRAASIAEHGVRIGVGERFKLGFRAIDVGLEHTREPFGPAFRLSLGRGLEAANETVVE
jgi:hypothetical protein